MITLQNKLYESLLDDEEELVNTDDIDFIIKDLKNKGFNRLKKTGNSVYIDDIISNASKNKTRELDTAFFNGYLGENFSYIDRFQIYGALDADDTKYPKTTINIKEVDIMRLNLTSDKDIDILKKFNNKINIDKCGYINIECKGIDEKSSDMVNNILPNKVEQVFLTRDSINILKSLKGKQIDLIRISASDLGIDAGNKNILPKAAAIIINNLHKNNNIGVINVAFSKMRTADMGNGIKMSKQVFKLIPYKNSYKIG